MRYDNDREQHLLWIRRIGNRKLPDQHLQGQHQHLPGNITSTFIWLLIFLVECHSLLFQLRLDFDTFVITGPSTITTTEVSGLFGMGLIGGTKNYAKSTQCLTDTFSVTNPGGIAPPVICGTNTGEHSKKIHKMHDRYYLAFQFPSVYVDASESCNTLAFILGQTAVDTNLATRSWSVRVTQYQCDYPNLAPKGCTQYFYGSDSGTFK